MTKLNITTDSYQPIRPGFSLRKLIRIIGITKNNIIWFLSRFIPQIESNVLFAGDDKLFKQILTNSKYYGEYGVGHSTKWVYKNTYAKIQRRGHPAGFPYLSPHRVAERERAPRAS